MNDNVDLLTRRLHDYINDLMTPGYSSDDFVCKCVADHLLFLMYGGVEGLTPVGPALDPERMKQQQKV